MKKNLLILFFICVSAIGYSQTFTDSNFITYNVTSTTPNTVEITGYNSTSGGAVVTIPETVINNSIAYSVTSIAFAAFQTTGLTSVSIPSSVQNIENQAFTGNNLTSITIPDGVVTIGGSAFRNNDLTHIIISGSVTNIEFAAFRDNPLASITSQAANPATVVTGGLNDSFWNRSVIDLTIPSSTSVAYASGGWTGFNSVAEAATPAVGDTFANNFITYEVTSLTPNRVEATDYDTAGGGTVNIPTSVNYNATSFTVNSIAGNAFVSKSLTSVAMSDSIESIGFLAFRNNQIATLTLSNNLTSIGVGAFQNNAITSITITDNITTISSNCFENNQLTNITIPANITSIQARAFTGNPLATITALGTTPAAISTAPPPNTTTDSFSFNRTTIDLIIPTGTSNAYLAASWTGFNSVTENSSLSTSDFELENDIKVFTSFNQLEVKHSKNIILEKFVVYNMTGANVMEGKENSISTETLSNGIYILELKFDNGSIAKKFVK